MKVKIVKCSSDEYWYFDRIGEIVEVQEVPRFIEYTNKCVYSLKHKSYLCIDLADTVIVVDEVIPPSTTKEWLHNRQEELRDYVVRCLENGQEIDKSITKEYYVNQNRLMEIG